MGTEFYVNATFQNNRGQTIPAVPGLLVWSFFGSMGSGNNGNLAPGGQPTIIYGTPTIAANFITTGRAGTSAVLSQPAPVGGVAAQPTVVSGGTNYNFPYKINYSGGGGSGASDITVVSGGAVTGLTSHVGGSGYTSAPASGTIYGNYDLVDTQITRAGGLLASGWTIAMVCRTPAAGVASPVFGDSYSPNQVGSPMFCQMNPTGNTFRSNFFVGGQVTLNLPSTTNNWRFVAETYSGGASGTEFLYSLSDGLSGTYVIPSGVAASTAQLTLGGGPAAGGAGNNTTDMAFAMVCAGALPQATLQAIYTSVKSVLANRGVVVV